MSKLHDFECAKSDCWTASIWSKKTVTIFLDWLLSLLHARSYAKQLSLLTTISMVPLEILVGICRAWKKLVFSGPRPVFWLGMVTGHGAIAPARAGAFFLLASSLSRTSTRSSLVKTKPTLLTIWGRSLQEGCCHNKKALLPLFPLYTRKSYFMM